jgi:glycosyltransferase involved in cell wall biosynthesis
VLPKGVDTTVYRPRPRGEARERLGLDQETRYCLFVGRFQYLKGADLLVPACRAAGYELLVAGAGEAHGGRSLGVLGAEQLALAYAAADCVLFPSRYEACSYVVLETLATGTPMVGTRVGWMPSLLEAVPGYDRLCVEPDLDQIVDRLQHLEQLAPQELLDQARAYVQRNNSLDSFAAGWQSLLDSLGFPEGRPRGLS